MSCALASRRWIPWVFSGSFVILYATLFFRQAGQLFVIDEAEFPLVAKGVATLGRPEYYRGDLLPNNLGIWHPPLYQYLLGMWEQLFGSSHVAARSFGFACTILAALLGVLILRRLFPRDYPWLSAAWLGAFLLHPLAIQGSLLPDIDSTVLVPIVMGIVWLAAEAVAGQRWDLPRVALFVGLLLGIAFLAKFTTPIALVPVALFILIRRSGSIRTGVLAVLTAGSVAVVTYVVVWGGLSRLIDVPFGYPWDFTRQSVSSKSGGQSLADRLPLLLPSDVVQFWLTPAALFLFVAALVAIVFRLRARSAQVLVCAAFVSLAIFFTYNVITGSPFGFPKYYAPIIGIGTLVIVGALGVFGDEVRSVVRTIASGWRMLAMIACVVLLTSIAYVQFARNERFFALPTRPMWFVVATAAAMAIVVLILGSPSRQSAAKATAIALAVGLIISTSASAAAVSLFQADTEKSVRYYPGEMDMATTVGATRSLMLGAIPNANTAPAHLIAAKDIGYEVGLPYYEDAAMLPTPNRIAALAKSRQPFFLVSRSYYDYGEASWPDAFKIVKRYMRPIWTSPHGYFRIWKSKPDPRRTAAKG